MAEESKLPDLDKTRMLAYHEIRYVAGYPENYVKEYAQAALQALAAEIAALREDAARYRWLRELPVECPTDGLDIAMWNDCHGEGIRGDALDAAIDSALLAAKEAKQ